MVLCWSNTYYIVSCLLITAKGSRVIMTFSEGRMIINFSPKWRWLVLVTPLVATNTQGNNFLVYT